MNTVRLLVVAACLCLTQTALAVGMGPVVISRAVRLQADGTVLLRPFDTIRLKFEIRDGKVVHVKAVPKDSKEEDSAVFSLARSGGMPTTLGVIVPIKDKLEVTTKLKGLLTFRCEYSFPDSPRPWNLLKVHGDRYFSRPVKEVRLSDFQFKPE
jgi:hypothetical protein